VTLPNLKSGVAQQKPHHQSPTPEGSIHLLPTDEGEVQRKSQSSPQSDSEILPTSNKAA